MNAWSSALEVVRSCLKAGAAEFVVCAGARNAVLLEVLARAEQEGAVRVWRHFEERSAGFFALGRTLATGAPCAVVTTSGTAVAELLPAVVEAHYQGRPLIALTADRPREYRGTGAPQVIEQVGIFGSYAEVCGWRDWSGRGPLHWNVELEEAFAPGDETLQGVEAAAFEPVHGRIDVAGLARWLRQDLFRGLVVLVGGLEPGEREEVFHFCRMLGAPLVADAASGLREALQGWVLPDGDRMLAEMPPGKVLRLGDVPCGRFWRDLEERREISVWSVCRNGLPGLARPSEVVAGAVDRVLKALGEVEEIGDPRDYFPRCSRRAAMVEELLEAYPDSEPGLLHTLSSYAAVGGGVFLGNSLPIREWNLFAQWHRLVPSVRANRGANGIDGQVSTWLGWSAEMAEAWAVVGDLTALYDLAGPFLLPQVEHRGRVLAVINNGGGKIFSRVPRLQAMHPRAVEWMVNPQSADLSGVARLWGLEHLRIATVDDFDRLAPGAKPLLLELLPDAGQTDRFWADWERISG